MGNVATAMSGIGILCRLVLTQVPRRTLSYRAHSLHVQDTFARTALHVAATCGAVEVVSMMCKFEAVDINPVDSFGDTPLNNARMNGQRAVSSLLEDAGALPGSDPSLAAKAEEVREWMRTVEDERRKERLEAALAALPEALAVQASAAVVKSQKEFVQV